MTKFDCIVVNCSYNENRLCKRDNITVGGMEAKKASETVCESFYPRGTNTMTNDGSKPNVTVCDDKPSPKYAPVTKASFHLCLSSSVT